jgi:hypothetical protein
MTTGRSLTPVLRGELHVLRLERPHLAAQRLDQLVVALPEACGDGAHEIEKRLDIARDHLEKGLSRDREGPDRPLGNDAGRARAVVECPRLSDPVGAHARRDLSLRGAPGPLEDRDPALEKEEYLSCPAPLLQEDIPRGELANPASIRQTPQVGYRKTTKGRCLSQATEEIDSLHARDSIIVIWGYEIHTVPRFTGRSTIEGIGKYTHISQ